MKLEFKISNKSFKEIIYQVLQTLIYLIRIFVMFPIIVLCWMYVPIMYVVGISKPFEKCIRLFEGITLNADED
jgi:hypothetical protein